MAQTNINIVPKPVELTIHQGIFIIDHSTVITAGTNTGHEAEMLNFYLKKFYGFTLPVKNTNPSANEKNFISLGLLKPAKEKKMNMK